MSTADMSSGASQAGDPASGARARLLIHRVAIPGLLAGLVVVIELAKVMG